MILTPAEFSHHATLLEIVGLSGFEQYEVRTVPPYILIYGIDDCGAWRQSILVHKKLMQYMSEAQYNEACNSCSWCRFTYGDPGEA